MAGIDSNTKLMLHMDGVDASTTFTDASDSAHSPTAVGNAQIDTAQSKFGGASGLFDGAGDYLAVPDHTDWDLFTTTSSEFTIDFWVRFTGLSAQGIIDQYVDTNNFWYIEKSTSKIVFFANSGGASTLIIAANWVPSINTWYHIALTRDATTRFIFIDGVAQALSNDVNIAMPALNAPLLVGKNTVNSSQLAGWVDEVRISDIARWTSGFTPPTSAYEPVTPDNIADPSTVTISLAIPVPTVILISNIVITPLPLAFAVTAETTPHVNSNVARPSPIAMGLNNADPLVDFGIDHPAEELTMSMNVYAPTIAIITQTIVSPDELSLTATAEEATGTPNYFFLDQPLPLMTLNASILNGFASTTALPMLTLNANCVVGFLTYTTLSLPMLTLSVEMGKKVSLSLPVFTLVASGTTSNGAKLTKPLPLFTLIASGKSTNNISLTQPLPMFTLDAVMVVGGVHLFAASLPMFTLNGEGINGGAAAVLNTNLPLVTLSSSGYSDENGTLTNPLPLLTLDAFGTAYANRII